jgi:hypothetical protein
LRQVDQKGMKDIIKIQPLKMKLFMPFVLVPQQHVMLIERFGRFTR